MVDSFLYFFDVSAKMSRTPEETKRLIRSLSERGMPDARVAEMAGVAISTARKYRATKRDDAALSTEDAAVVLTEALRHAAEQPRRENLKENVYLEVLEYLYQTTEILYATERRVKPVMIMVDPLNNTIPMRDLLRYAMGWYDTLPRGHELKKLFADKGPRERFDYLDGESKKGEKSRFYW